MRYCGREFSAADISSIRQLIEKHPTATRARLSRLVCEHLDWRRDDGRLKDMSCRVAMLRMQDDALLQLPPRHATATTTASRISAAPCWPSPPPCSRPHHPTNSEISSFSSSPTATIPTCTTSSSSATTTWATSRFPAPSYGTSFELRGASSPCSVLGLPLGRPGPAISS